MSAKKKREVTYYLPKERLVVSGWRYVEDYEQRNGYACHRSYFCPGCGQVWAIEEVQFGQFYSAVYKPCSSCDDRNGAVPGSILYGYLTTRDRARWDGAPHDLLIYEFLNLEKQNANRKRN